MFLSIKCIISRGSMMEFGKLTRREQEIVHHVLLEYGITDYEILNPLSEGHDLPGSTYEGEIEWISGTIVTPITAYSFWLDWIDGHYTLGKEQGFWREIDLEEDADAEAIIALQQQLRKTAALPLKKRNTWPIGFQQALIQTFTASFPEQWGYNIAQNAEFFYRLREELQRLPSDELRILSEDIDQRGIVFRLAAGASITSLAEITKILFRLFTALHEKVFVFFPMHTDEGVLHYLFITGKPSHGHIGMIQIRLEDAPYLEDVSELEFVVPGIS